MPQKVVVPNPFPFPLSPSFKALEPMGVSQLWKVDRQTVRSPPDRLHVLTHQVLIVCDRKESSTLKRLLVPLSDVHHYPPVYLPYVLSSTSLTLRPCLVARGPFGCPLQNDHSSMERRQFSLRNWMLSGMGLEQPNRALDNHLHSHPSSTFHPISQ